MGENGVNALRATPGNFGNVGWDPESPVQLSAEMRLVESFGFWMSHQRADEASLTDESTRTARGGRMGDWSVASSLPELSSVARSRDCQGACSPEFERPRQRISTRSNRHRDSME